MSASTISPAAYDSTVAELRTKRRLPSLEEFSSAAGNGSPKTMQVMDFSVDLRQVLRDAYNNKCDVLRVYADVVRVPGNFPIEVGNVGVGNVGKTVRRLDIVARRMEIEGSARAELRLSDDPERAAATTARLFIGDITGELFVGLDSGGTVAEFTRVYPSPDLRPCTYQVRKGDSGTPTLIGAQTKLGLEMLDKEGPLYQLLMGSFGLAAGLTAAVPLDHAKLELARSILTWLTRWSAYPSADLIPLFRTATTLLRMLPTAVDDPKPAIVVHVVPEFTPRAYFEMAKSQWDSAKDYDLEAKFAEVGNQIGKATELVVGIWEKRDGVDIAELDKRIDLAKDRITKAIAAIKEVGKEMEEQAFENRFSERELKLVQETEFIKGAVKSAFEAVFAIAQIGAGVASGVGTGALGKINPGPMLSGLAGTNLPLGLKAMVVATGLFVYPKFVWDEFWQMDPKARKTLVEAGKSVFSGFKSIYDSADRVRKLAKDISVPNPKLGLTREYPEADEIGEIVSTMANALDPPRTKAAWDAFLAEAVSQFDMITSDPETPGPVRDAAISYRLGIEKLAIYGRMLSERQAILAQEIRELGSLILSKASAKQKQAQLGSIGNNLGDEAAARKALATENDNRLRELGRTFFATSWGFRSALYYEAMKWELPLLTVPTNGLQMGDVYKEMERAMLQLQQAKRGNLNKSVWIKEQPFLDELKRSGSAKIGIGLAKNEFAGYDRVRIKSLDAWLEDVVPSKTSGVRVRMTSEASFRDRTGEIEFSFTAEPAEIVFRYLSDSKVEFNRERLYIEPTPFSTWTLRIENKDDLKLNDLSAVRLVFDCEAQAGVTKIP